MDDRWFEVANPVTFCSDRCRKVREKQITRAIHDLAKDVERGDAAEMLADAECLWSLWFTRRGDDLVHKYWSGLRPSMPLPPDDPRIRLELAQRISRLREVVRADEARRAREQRQTIERRVAVGEQSAQAAADRAWREALLSGAGAGGK